MRVVIPFLLLFIFHQVFTAREVKFDSLHYSPVESDLLDYGTLKLTKAKIRNTFYLNGNFTIKRMIGNEKLVKFEVWARGGGMLITSTHAFCEFTNIDKSLWPDLMKASTMPKNNPCPFPEVNAQIVKKMCSRFLIFTGQLQNQKVCSQRDKNPAWGPKREIHNQNEDDGVWQRHFVIRHGHHFESNLRLICC